MERLGHEPPTGSPPFASNTNKVEPLILMPSVAPDLGVLYLRAALTEIGSVEGVLKLLDAVNPVAVAMGYGGMLVVL